MGCYISNLRNLNLGFKTYFFLVGDYSNRSFVNDLFRYDFRNIARRIGANAMIVDQNDQLEQELLEALANFPDSSTGLSASQLSVRVPGLLIVDRPSMEILVQFYDRRSLFQRHRQPASSSFNIVFIPFELMEQAYSSPNILIRDIVDFALCGNDNLLRRTLHAETPGKALESAHSFNRRWSPYRYDYALRAPYDFRTDPYDEGVLCRNVEAALTNLLRNSLYHGLREDPTNDVLRDNLRMIYPVSDQTRQGESESGKDAGRLDLLITDHFNTPYALIEALRLSSLDSGNLSSHFSKALTKYDPLGLAVDFLVCYVSCADFDAFCGRLRNWLDTWESPYERVGPVRELPGPFAEMRHFELTLRRQGMPFHVHTYAIHLPR